MIKKLLAIYQKLNKREKIIFYATFLILGLWAVDGLILRPIFQKMMTLNRQVKDEEMAIKKSLHILLRKNQIAADGKQFTVFSMDSQNPEQEMTMIQKEIESIANRSAVNLLYQKPGNVKEDSGVKKYYVTLECEGQMAEVSSFFHNVENSTRLLQIEKYSIQPKNKESSIARCSVTISRTILS